MHQRVAAGSAAGESTGVQAGLPLEDVIAGKERLPRAPAPGPLSHSVL